MSISNLDLTAVILSIAAVILPGTLLITVASFQPGRLCRIRANIFPNREAMGFLLP